jgi:hypothetical protein
LNEPEGKGGIWLDDVLLLIGGSQGSGVETSSLILTSAWLGSATVSYLIESTTLT